MDKNLLTTSSIALKLLATCHICSKMVRQVMKQYNYNCSNKYYKLSKYKTWPVSRKDDNVLLGIYEIALTVI